MGAQEDLIQSLSVLGSLAASSALELYVVGGVPRDLLYRVLQQKEFSHPPEVLSCSSSLTSLQQVNLFTFMVNSTVGAEPRYRDIDLLINTAAEEWINSIKEEFKSLTGRSLQVIEVYKPFQTVKVKIEGLEVYDIEFASARTEKYPEPAAFPVVSLTKNIREDLPRRDFTINALLISLHENFGELVDYSFLGATDMRKGLVRAFHPNSFIDDPTRIYRAFRFSLEYGFEIESETASWIKAALKDERFPQWFKKRKNRFLIELAKYRSLIPAALAEYASQRIRD